ncbi:acetate--CoA ligase [Zhengella mangrovi]|uniref:acetate--CoA ligase n=2 Tax=Zhengella mangrovi TaxID=1982044 RepID=A0A2G1QKG8_9HYPH|nr:acetate--CoA ligase [Zhengella mangrovi]
MMRYPVIEKSAGRRAAANMPDYAAERAAFSWDKAADLVEGLAGGKLNIAHEAVTRHARPDGERIAMRWIDRAGQRSDISYGELDRRTSRFANVLRGLGIGRGARVYSLLGRVPELYVAALGTLKAGCVYSPLFSAFGPEPVRSRMEIGGANVLVTSKALYRRKVAPILSGLPDLRAVLLIDADGGGDAGLHDLAALMDGAGDTFETEAMAPEETALLHFTSGTTGKPKGAVHVHQAVIAHTYTGRTVLDLKPGDIYWCTADPGWVTGTSYGIIAPLSNGVTMIIDEADFDAERWYAILEAEKVNVWYTAPTAIRMLMKAGRELAAGRDLSALRFMASVGEPLNPEAVMWGEDVFGMPFHDNWWQTETGGIMIANYASMDVKPGSMGKPLPGIEAAIVTRRDGVAHAIGKPGTVGELALRPGWPSMMRAYLHEEERYAKCFSGGWYLSGDLAMKDDDGYFWFVGRADDVIKSAGHLIGPFEVESALMEHEAVAEAGVIGIPDETAGEIVKAFVALKPGFEPSEDLRLDLIGHARKRLGPAVAPKDIAFRGNLPKTRSGKIMRRLLKARELGLAEGDISTLESDET